jgi:hypothetical protein
MNRCDALVVKKEIAKLQNIHAVILHKVVKKKIFM